MPVSGDGASSLCMEYEEKLFSPRKQRLGLLDALERNEKSSEAAEEESGLPGEEEVMTSFFFAVTKYLIISKNCRL